MTTTPALAVRALRCGYGRSDVVHGVSIEVRPGEIVALLGANGSGKTTTLLGIAGALTRSSGQIELLGAPVARWATARRARHGLALIPDDRGLFPQLTVQENLLVARRRNGVDDPLELFAELHERRKTRAGLLSGGQQQMLAIARALASSPKVLLIDELSLGLAPQVVHRLVPVLREIAADGCAIVLVEQHVHLALDIADRAYVLSHGRQVLEGAAAELRDDQRLLQASYLGETATADDVPDP